MRLLILLLTLLLPALAAASDLTIQWTPPTERVDGRALDPTTEIDRYDLQCRDVESNDWTVQLDIPGLSDQGEFTSPLIELFPEYGVFVCRMAAVDTGGLYSDWVPVEGDPVEIRQAPPRAPTGVLRLTSGGG